VPAAGSRTRLLLATVSLGLVAWPFMVVTFPPLADLPQHAAQVRLLGEALAGDGAYAVQWGTPYSLAYLPLAAATALAGPLAGARLGAMLIALAWVGAVHLLAWRLGRSAAAATAASVLVFHHALYWGFLPFLVGFPVFAAWLLLVRQEPRPRVTRAALFTGGALLLYTAHALWFAAGLGWLALDVATRHHRGTPWRHLVARLAGPAAVAAAAVAWFRALSSSSFATPPLWVPQPWRRLLPGSWVEAAFGGLAGLLEPLTFAALAAWLVAALVVHLVRSTDREKGAGDRAPEGEATGWDYRLLSLGLLLLAGALLLPDKYTNTIEFNDRWFPPALALLLLAAPRLPLRPTLTRAAAVTLLGAFVMTTAVTWQRAEAEELAGLAPALASLPDEPRLLGLEFPRRSRYLDRQPYLQIFAWGQVLRGGELNFSFADFPPSPVVYRPPRRPPWTPGLEWFPQRVRPGDFGWFTHVLVRAPPAIHSRFEAAAYLVPVNPPAPWRLYRVGDGAPRENRRVAPQPP